VRQYSEESKMTANFDELRSLSAAEKLQIVELLWDDLGAADAEIPLPEWIDREAARRRDEMLKDPTIGLSHDEAWQRIRRSNG
jgi:putative addiction module component (TIGR02574 family)